MPRQLRQLLMLALVLALTAAGLAAGIVYYLDRNYANPLKAGLPPAVVHIGAPLGWRVLRHEPRLPAEMPQYIGLDIGTHFEYGGLAAGDFDGDGAEEVLLLGDAEPSFMYELAGGRRRVSLRGSGLYYQAVAWDCDRDGTDELLPHKYQLWTMLYRVGFKVGGRWLDYSASGIREGGALPVLRLDGSIAARLPTAGQNIKQLTGDLSGDGWDEVLLPVSEDEPVWAAYGAGGAEVWRLVCENDPISTTVVDMDADGTAEWVDMGNRVVYSMPYGTRPLSDYMQPAALDYLADLNGDGVAEIVSSYGYRDVAAEDYVSFKEPTALSGQTMLREQHYPLDLDGDGLREVVFTPPGLSWITAYGVDGACVYYEELGDVIFDSCTATAADGTAHLFVLTSERLIRWP